MDLLLNLIGWQARPAECKLKFRFVGTFQTAEDEDQWHVWREANLIDPYFHVGVEEIWPRNCNITVFATDDKIKAIKGTRWYVKDWATAPVLG